MSQDEILVAREGPVGRLTLNRPKAIGALNTPMVEIMTRALLEWRADPSVHAVLLDHAGERGFCAGGDIRFLAESGAAGGAAARDFFFQEYRLNHLLFVYPKPVVALMDGIVMGGGVGISLPAQVRIATERTVFAMPETGIGLFPDVGGGWHLPRLPGETGLWLALTGARLKAADCLALGIATHGVLSSQVDGIRAALIADPAGLPAFLNTLRADLGETPLAPHRDAIDRLFAGDRLETIFEALDAEASAWAKAQLQILNTKSPLSMKTALRQLRLGARLTDFADNMAMEMRIGARIVISHDFAEGVRAVIVDKDNAPIWNPASLAGVDEARLQSVFAPLPPDQEWSPLPELVAKKDAAHGL
jgi:enoyl-CoA hydratase